MPKKFIPSLCERSTIQGYSSAESDLEINNDVTTGARRSRSRHKLSLHYPRPHSHLFRDRFGGRSRGGRHGRRHDNSLFLSTLYQIDEDEYVDDHNSVIPEHNTPFTRLFTNTDEHKLWQSFDSMTEDEQEAMLSIQPAKKSLKRVDDGRKELLKHLDPRLRKVLAHTKRIPKEFMSSIEEELREFFSDDTMSVLVLIQLTSFQRMLVHGICQHNGLKSQRYQNNDDQYLVITTEKDDEFEPPIQTLASILK